MRTDGRFQRLLLCRDGVTDAFSPLIRQRDVFHDHASNAIVTFKVRHKYPPVDEMRKRRRRYGAYLHNNSATSIHTFVITASKIYSREQKLLHLPKTLLNDD